MVVVPWHNAEQLASFKEAWSLIGRNSFMHFQQDREKEGCATTKNKGIAAAIEKGAETIIVLDDDCFPHFRHICMEEFISFHESALEPVAVPMFKQVTTPPSRGTPYFERTIKMPVAASMGFWSEVGDYDAPGQLVHGATHPMRFDASPVFGQYFPLCGMNIAFRASQWPWCQFVDVPRFDDIWGGFLWQRRAYSVGECFNLSGPMVRHSRQSNVWKNLRDEAQNLERNETIWQQIHRMPVDISYNNALRLLEL